MSTLKAINVQHPSASTTNIVNDASGNVALGNNLTVAGTATITGATTVGGVAVVAVAPSTSGNVLTSNGTAWTSAAPSGGGLPTPSAIGQIPFSTNGSTYAATQKIVQGTAVASTSGTSIDFTSIPSWVKRVTVMFSGVSTSGTSNPLIQIGSGSVQSTGYTGYCTNVSTSTITSTSGFPLNSAAAANTLTGFLVLDLLASNKWVIGGNSVLNQSGTIYALMNSGEVTLSGALDRVRITTVGGTDTFDAGSINILYE